MIIYLLDPQKTEMASWLNQTNIDLWQKPQDSGNIESWDQLGMNPLERIDAMIIEISEADQQINYLLAQAILLQKNTLCVYKRTQAPRQLLMYLHKKNVPRCIQTMAYSSSNLKEAVLKFVKSIKPQIELEEVPNIKYTLRITESLEKYLNWKSKHTKINKADFIRDIINKLKKEDQDYQKRLDDRNK